MDNQNNVDSKIDKSFSDKGTIADTITAPRHPESRLAADWLFLYQKLPAEHWRDPKYSHKTASLLRAHNGIRRRQQVLKQLSYEYQISALNWSNYRLQVMPRIEENVFKLHQHHSIEDVRYFPSFVQDYPQLKAGFEILERDHERLALLLDEMQTLNHRLINSETEDKILAQELHQTLSAASDLLTQHLSDEEDLVIPILGLH